MRCALEVSREPLRLRKTVLSSDSPDFVRLEDLGFMWVERVPTTAFFYGGAKKASAAEQLLGDEQAPLAR
jgi:hypothetical protein